MRKGLSKKSSLFFFFRPRTSPPPPLPAQAFSLSLSFVVFYSPDSPRNQNTLSFFLFYAFSSLPAISGLGLGLSPKSGTNPTFFAISASVLHSLDSGEHAPSV